MSAAVAQAPVIGGTHPRDSSPPSNRVTAVVAKSAKPSKADKKADEKPVAKKPVLRPKNAGLSKGAKVPHGMMLDKSGKVVTLQEYTLGLALDSANTSLSDYRDRMQKLVSVNSTLQEDFERQENDSLTVISALYAENETKIADIKNVREEYQEKIRISEREKAQITEKYELKVHELVRILTEKDVAFKDMQQEVQVIKDFRKKRNELVKELEIVKTELEETQQKHKDVVIKMERKFFEEKLRLQKEANRKLDELADKAHKEAINSLQDTTKDVFKENIRLTDALKHHLQEGQELTKLNAKLTVENKEFLAEKEFHNTIVREKILENKNQKNEITELQQKIQNMEYSLSHVVREFEYERDLIGRRTRQELDQVRSLAIKLKEKLHKKTTEMKHIRFLAQHILNQRTDVERFFMDALDAVRREMQRERHASRKKAQEEYNRKMKLALLSKDHVPAVRSFRPSLPVAKTGYIAAATILEPNRHFSNEDVAADLPGVAAFPRAPSPPPDPKSKLDISEISWTDKERVLRLLFAQMNGLMIVNDDPRQKNVSTSASCKQEKDIEEEDEEGDLQRSEPTDEQNNQPLLEQRTAATVDCIAK